MGEYIILALQGGSNEDLTVVPRGREGEVEFEIRNLNRN